MFEFPLADNPIDLEREKLKIDSESKPVEFSDLPTDVLKVIIEKSELKERFILRKVSRGLCSLVDQARPNFKKLSIRSERDHMYLFYDHITIIYAGPDYEKIPSKNPKTSKFRRHHVIDEHYRKVFFEDLKISLKNPKLKLEYLDMSPSLNPSTFYGDVARLLKSIDMRCHVERLYITVHSQDHAHSILPYFKPRVLKKIYLFPCWDINKPLPLLPIDKLTGTEQWKRAEVACVGRFKIEEPMKSFYHLRHFSARWNQVTPEMLKGLRDALSESANFKDCVISTDDDIEDAERIMGPGMIDKYDLMYPIPNSSNYLHTAVIHRNYILINKKSKY